MLLFSVLLIDRFKRNELEKPNVDEPIEETKKVEEETKEVEESIEEISYLYTLKNVPNETFFLLQRGDTFYFAGLPVKTIYLNTKKTFFGLQLYEPLHISADQTPIDICRSLEKSFGTQAKVIKGYVVMKEGENILFLVDSKDTQELLILPPPEKWNLKKPFVYHSRMKMLANCRDYIRKSLNRSRRYIKKGLKRFGRHFRRHKK